jgi:LPS-assembly protein
VHSAGFATRNFDSFSFNAVLSQTENFQSLQPGDTVRLRTVPEAEFQSVQRPLWRGAPLYIAWESSVGWVSRKEPAPPNGSGLRTGWMERLEFYPRLTLPLRWRWFQMTPTLGYRATQYGKQRQQGALVNEPWLRDTTSLAVDWALPPLEKTYSGAGALYPAPFRHVVEPRVMFRLTNGVGDFSRALLFDERDLIANTRELEYSLTQRVFVKSSDGNPREAFSWEVKQQYYFDPAFGGALVSGERNILPSSLALSGTAFLDTPRRFSPVISILKFSPSYRYDVELREDYDTGLRRFTRGGLTGSAHFGEVFLSLNHSFVRTAPELAFPSNQMGFSLGYGNLLRQGWNAAFAGAYDVKEGFLQFTAFQASYNNNCCGISVEFRRFALGPARNENQFRVAFSIANVGTFGTLKKQERLF